MPVVKIEMSNKWKIETALLVKKTVSEKIRSSFGLKSTDRNIRVIRYDQDLFELKNPYEIFIEIQLISGRDDEFKKKLYQSLVNAIDEKTIFNKENVFIFLNEQPACNWGIKGGFMAD